MDIDVSVESGGIIDAKPDIFPASIGINPLEAAVLADIEREDEEERERKTSITPMHDASMATGPTMVPPNLNVDLQQQYASFSTNDEVFDTSAHNYSLVQVFMDAFRGRIPIRLKLYSAYLFLVVTSFAGGAIGASKIQEWFFFYICSISIEFLSAIADCLFFVGLDYAFQSNFKVAYIMKALNGPLGWILATYGFLTLLHARLPMISENIYVMYITDNTDKSSIMIIFFLFVCKQYYERIYYVEVLETRFGERVYLLDTWTTIISELASTKPPSSLSTSKSASASSSSLSSQDANKRIKGASYKVRDAFRSIVQATSNMQRARTESANEQPRWMRRRAGSYVPDEDGESSSRGPMWSFWDSCYRLSGQNGSLRLQTYNGEAFIRKNRFATIFGKGLYRHLSRAGKVNVTHALIKGVLTKAMNPDRDDGKTNEKDGDRERGRTVSGREEEEDAHLRGLLEEAIKLLDPQQSGMITEENCVNALCEVYKRHRYAAESLNGFGELHSSLRIVIGAIFWICVIVISQVFLGIDIASNIFPFVTLVFSAGFFLGPLVQSILLSMTFVLSMKPFDIGHKIKVNKGDMSENPNDVEGVVRSVSLMYTTLKTDDNHVIRVPNHRLFYANIQNDGEFNLGVRFSLGITFTWKEQPSEGSDDGRGAKSDKVIEGYVAKIRSYVEHRKTEWGSFALHASSVSLTDRSITYQLLLVHKEGYMNIEKALASRTQLYAFLHSLNQNMQ